jgi:hypothetical protein
MKHTNDLQKQPQTGNTETPPAEKISEPIVSVIPGINRFIDDLRTGYRSGSRIDVQIDWAQGRMAISH